MPHFVNPGLRYGTRYSQNTGLIHWRVAIKFKMLRADLLEILKSKLEKIKKLWVEKVIIAPI
jgi:hypothetical protein